ncbi:MAG: hypothetical protein II008_07675 [Oscillospiraceae bacterium]|nr:hypothetical protein [Oscillospiraceae bacterium]
MNEFDKELEDIKQREIDMGIQITTVQADRDYIRSELRDCVNELCLQCGQYRTEHLGSCDSCRWKKVKEGFR